MLQKWIEILKEYTETDLTRLHFRGFICSQHFQDSDYDEKRNLLKSAVPNVLNCTTVRNVYLNTIKNLKNEFHKSQKRERYKKEKLKTMQDVIAELEKQNLIDERISEILTSQFENVPAELIKNQFQNHDKGKERRYSEEVKAFANTVYFYSPKAYKYIQPILNLPHPKYVQSWATTTDAEPGYLKEIINLIRDEVAKDPSRSTANLVIDEMTLHADTPYNPSTKKYEGQVNLGFQTDDNNLATHALVVMAMGVTSRWKYPIAYFFTSSVKSENLVDIINHSLTLMEDAGVNVLNVTTDDVSANWTAMTKLGCKLCVTKLDPTFQHPSNPSKRVHYTPDTVHMVKLIRNLLSDLKILKIKDTDKTIE